MRRYQKDDFPALTSDRLAILQRATTKEEVQYGGLGESGRVIPWRNRGGRLNFGRDFVGSNLPRGTNSILSGIW